jgi:hypothetical protein
MLVWRGANPALGGVGMAAPASVFCVLLGYMRAAGSGRLRLYPVAPGTGNDAGGDYLAGDGPQHDAVRRGHRRCDRPS